MIDNRELEFVPFRELTDRELFLIGKRLKTGKDSLLKEYIAETRGTGDIYKQEAM